MRRLLMLAALACGSAEAAPPITTKAQEAWNRILIDLDATETRCLEPNPSTICASVDLPFSAVKSGFALHKSELKQLKPWKEYESTPTSSSYGTYFQVAGGTYSVVAFHYDGTTFLSLVRQK